VPVYLPPISRRQFLVGAAAVGGGLVCNGLPGAADQQAAVDPHRFALLSDVHIAADRAKVFKGVTMAGHLGKAVSEVVALSPRPAAAAINGDLAFGTGESGDYGTLLELLKPMREAGLPVHLGLGNHDHRERFRVAVTDQASSVSPCKDRAAYVVESPRANWFVLDSLLETNKVPGTVGDEQRRWLAQGLEARKDKPAIVLVHHNLDKQDPTRGGLTDTFALLGLLHAYKNAKALIWGHTHAWSVKEEDGLHLINLPPVAYVFQEGMPSGWVDMNLAEGGATLELRCIDPTHEQHGERHELRWRPT
jgi:hypothetical protein